MNLPPRAASDVPTPTIADAGRQLRLVGESIRRLGDAFAQLGEVVAASGRLRDADADEPEDLP